MGDDRCVLLFFFFLIFYPYNNSLTVNPDGAEADHMTIASRAIDSRVPGTWEDRVGIPGVTRATRALPDQLTSNMFPSVDSMRRRQSQLSSEVSGRVLIDYSVRRLTVLALYRCTWYVQSIDILRYQNGSLTSILIRTETCRLQTNREGRKQPY